MSLLKLYAAQNKDLGLVDLRKKVLDSRITYTRTGTKAYFDRDGLLKHAAADVWPREFDPATGECRGRSVWPQATNLCLWSEQLNSATWTKTRSSVTVNAVAAPDGAVTADKLIEDTTAAASHTMSQTISFVSGTTYCFSIFVKAAERTRFRLIFSSAAMGAGIGAIFDVSTGTVVSESGPPLLSRITPAGNGWYRCSVSATATATVAAAFNFQLADATGALTYTGDGVSGIYAWGAQMETGIGNTPYIPTPGASTVTRGADNASVTPTSVGYSDTSGTIWAEVMRHHNDGAASGVVVAGSSGSNYNALRATGGGGLLGVTLSAAATVGSVPIVAAPWYDMIWTVGAYSYALNDFRGAAEGVLGTADTSGALPVGAATAIWIGRIDAGSHFNGWIRRFRIMRRLTDTELAEATS
jgi:hypothetical protein